MSVESAFSNPLPEGHPSYAEENVIMIGLAVKERLIDAALLADVARKAHESGGVPLGRILLRDGICGMDQVRKLISMMPSKLAYCPACRGTRATGRPFEAAPCDACGTKLVLLEFAWKAARGVDGRIYPWGRNTTTHTATLTTRMRRAVGFARSASSRSTNLPTG